jgi:hypothetical protein
LKENKKPREAGPEDKEKISRVGRRHQKEAKKKRKVIIVLILVVGAVLAIGGIFNIPYINVVREGGSWIGERFSGTAEEDISSPDYAFLTEPLSGRYNSGEVDIILALYDSTDTNNAIVGLVLLTYDVEGAKGELYILPEITTAYNAAGEEIELSQALGEEGGDDLLRSTVNNMTGADVDYLVRMGFPDGVLSVQRLGFPSMLMEEDEVLVNPISNEFSYIDARQEVGDADRIISYLLAVNAEDINVARVKRAGDYLPEAFAVIRGVDISQLQESLDHLEGDDLIDPSPGSREDELRYLASMIQAFADIEEGKLVYRGVPRVEVLNGCGVPDLGKKVGDELIAKGVAVAGTGGNAKTTVDGEEVNDFSHERSSIIYRSQDKRVVAYAEYLAVLLAINEVDYEPGPGPEVVLIAGRDRAG